MTVPAKPGRAPIDLTRMLAPRSIAVVGATERANAPSRRILETLQKLEFTGRILPVHPTNERVLGLQCYPSLADVPGEIDAVCFTIDSKHLPDAMRQAAAKGAGAGVIFGAIRGSEGLSAEEITASVRRTAHESGIAICGPNCMGMFSAINRVSLYLQTIIDPSRMAGNVGLVTQSGSVAVGMLGDVRRFGFSHLISCGEEVATTMDQYVEHLIDDPATDVIALFIESVRDVDGFTAALDRAAQVGKPVVALKIGRSALSRAAVVGHTGGIAGDGRVFSALMARHHGIEVTSLEEMTEVIAACQSTRRPRGPRLGVLTASGGHVEMILDEAEGAPFELPPLSESERVRAAEVIGPVSGTGNPLDAFGTGDYQKSMSHGVAVLDAQPDIDAIVLVSDTNDGQVMSPTRYTDLLYEGSLRSGKPYYFMNTRGGLMRQELVDKFRGTGVGMLTGLRPGLAAVGRLGRWARRAALPPEVKATPAAANEALAKALVQPRATINEVDAKTVLRAARLTTVDDHAVTSADQAVAVAEKIGYPVVLKVASDAIPHRSEHGLVAVGLTNANTVADAFVDHARRVKALAPKAPVAHVVQPMAPKGVEVIVGVGRDPELGLYLAFGAGGVLVELIEDAVVRPLPLREGEALAMVQASRIHRLLQGYRGRPPADIAALVTAIERVAAFAVANRDRIDEIDLNPIFVSEAGRGCTIADALIVPARR